MRKLILLVLLVFVVGCATLTEEERVYRKYQMEDKYQRDLAEFEQLKVWCQNGIWVIDPSSQYRRTGIPTRLDLFHITCGRPIHLSF